MITRRAMLAILVSALSLPLIGSHAPAQEADKAKVKVVATFSILADLVRNVGGDRIDVTALVGPNGDAHVYAPTPADARTLGAAQLVVTNGLGFEGWMERLVKASGTKATMVVAAKGVKPRRSAGDDHGHGGSDPHAWQSVANVMIYVANIRDALAKVDPAGKATYEANAAAYLAKLDALDREVKETVAKIPPERRRIITTHDAFGYFGEA